MTLPEITNSLAGWNMPVSHEQLLRPSPDFVQTVYCACLQQVSGITHEVLNEPVQAALVTLEDPNPDLYSSALAHNIIVYHITRFAKAAKIDDFCASDISHPERERTIDLLSAFINFIKFTEQCCDVFVKNLQDKSAGMIAERDQMSLALQEVQEKIRGYKARRAKDEPRCEELRVENSKLTARMFNTKDVQVSVVQAVEMLKTEKSSLLKRKESLNNEIAMVADTIQRSRSRIVQSPERIRRTIATMGSTAIEDKRTVMMHETKARDLQAKINILLCIEKDIRGCIEQLQSIEKEVTLLCNSQKELVNLKDQLDDKKIERSELYLHEERVRKQLSNAHEKLERAQRHAEDKRVASQKTIDRLQREYNEMAIERRDNDKQVEELRTEADEVEAKMAEHLRKSEIELNELLAEYWKLRHETDVYMETLANKLNMRVTTE